MDKAFLNAEFREGSADPSVLFVLNKSDLNGFQIDRLAISRWGAKPVTIFDKDDGRVISKPIMDRSGFHALFRGRPQPGMPKKIFAESRSSVLNLVPKQLAGGRMAVAK